MVLQKEEIQNEISRLQAQKKRLESDDHFTKCTRAILVPFYDRNLLELKHELEMKEKQQ